MCYHYTIPAYEVDAVDSGSLSEITVRLGLRRRDGSSSDFLNYIRICREYHRLGILCKWSGKRGSNPPPPPWQGGALPNELFPHIKINLKVVRAKRLELIHPAAPEPKSGASANSATPAYHKIELGDPSEIRTPDTLIKSQVLYRLS